MIDVLCHSSIRIEENKIIYVDPFKIEQKYNDADYIFCTHSHYDHFSPEDIGKVKKDDTIIIVPSDIEEQARKIFNNNVVIVEPAKEYQMKDLEFKTTYAYNINKKFHPKENKWVGYIIELNNKKYYIAGDTDSIEEIQNIECDIALIPIGGIFTMDYKEATELANTIKADIVIPTHYGNIVGEKEDAIKFKELVNDKKVEVLI